MRGFFLILVLSVFFNLPGLAAPGDQQNIKSGEDENAVLKKEITYVGDLFSKAGLSLHESIYDYYASIVYCFQYYPKQGRGYPGNFRGCLKNGSDRFSVRAYSAISASRLKTFQPLRVQREFREHYVQKLDAVLRAKSGSQYGVIDVGAKLADGLYQCATAPAVPAPDKVAISPQKCVETASWGSVRDIYRLNGAPGSEDSPSDLAYITREQPRFSYVAHFNDTGRYYNYGNSNGLPAGQFTNNNVPVLSNYNFYEVFARNAYISYLLFGSYYYGYYGYY